MTLKAIWRRSSPGVKRLADSHVAILDGKMENLLLRRKYVEAHSGKKVGTFICINELLYRQSIWTSCWQTGFTLGFVLLFLPWLIFSRRRVNFARFSSDLLSLHNLMDILESNQVNQIYAFFIFRGSANLEAMVMRRKGIRVSKVTSVTPLSFHNHSTLADELIVNTRYQFEEYPHFRKSLLVDEVAHWGPEMSLKWEEKYASTVEPPAPVAQIGYYSSGHWLRKKLKHMGTGLGDAESDEKLQEFLGDYLRRRPKVKLAIFTHPIEKLNPVFFAEACAHYANIFQGLNIEVVSPKINTIGNLEYVDIAVGVISSTLTERLYFGFKAIFAPIEVKKFPLFGTSIVSIAPRNKEALFELLDRSLSQSRKEFFDYHGLNNYRFSRLGSGQSEKRVINEGS